MDTTLELGTELPQHLRRLSTQLERGALEVGVRPAGVEPVLRRIEGLVNRLVLGMLASAFIIGLAVLLAVYRLAGWERWAGAFFTIGLVAALSLGGSLAWSILRSRR